MYRCHPPCTEAIQYCLDKSGRYGEPGHLRFHVDAASVAAGKMTDSIQHAGPFPYNPCEEDLRPWPNTYGDSRCRRTDSRAIGYTNWARMFEQSLKPFAHSLIGRPLEEWHGL